MECGSGWGADGFGPPSANRPGSASLLLSGEAMSYIMSPHSSTVFLQQPRVARHVWEADDDGER